MMRPPHHLLRHLLFVIALLIAVTTAFGLYMRAEKSVDEAMERHHESYALIDELRQTSDDLTRMVRTYVVTGDARYLQYFQDILAMRDGKLLRPYQLGEVYWDLIVAEKPHPAYHKGQAVALLTLMQQASFAPEELASLESAKVASDRLALLEQQAMDLVAELDPQDHQGLDRARAMVHDRNYHEAKATVMQAIDQCFHAVDLRTDTAVANAQQMARFYSVVVALLGLALMASMGRALHAARKLLGASIPDVFAKIADIGSRPLAENTGTQATYLGSLMDSLTAAEANLRKAEAQATQSHLALSATLARLQRVAANVPVVVFEYCVAPDGSRSLPYVSQSFHELTGMDASMLTDDVLSIYNIVHPADREAMRVAFRSGVQTISVIDHQFRVNLPDSQQPRWQLIHVVPQREADGMVRCFGYLLDVTEQRRALQAREDSDYKSRALFNSSPVPMLVCSIQNDTIVEVNDAGLQLAGGCSRSLVGKRLCHLFVAKDKCSALVQAIHQSGTESIEAELRLDGKNTTLCTVTASRVDLTTGPVLIAALQDVTEQRRHEAQVRELNATLELRVRQRTEDLTQEIQERRIAEAELRLAQQELADAKRLAQGIVEFAPYAVWAIAAGQSQPFIVHNLMATEITGYRASDFSRVSEWHRSLYPDPVYRAEVLQNWADQTDNAFSAAQATREITCKNGERKWVHFGRSQLADGTFVVFGQDVTMERQQRVALNDAMARAEGATRAKSEFLANMSHEIRTPMNAIIGMSHLALQQGLAGKAHNYVSKVNLAARNLLGIINDILDFSKIEAGKLQVESIPFDVNTVLEQLSSLVGLKAAEKGLELHFDLPLDLPQKLVGDPLRLGQILVNLGNNAVKFTESGSIVVGAERIAQSPERIEMHFWVKDTGIGMTPVQLERMFQSFSQADRSTARKYGGTGLGLTISKRLVELMSGRIWVESMPGVGSIFHFHACFAPCEEQEPQRPAWSMQAFNALPVLIADGNPVAREALQRLCTQLGLRPELASTANEAIHMVTHRQANGLPFAAVLMDQGMPDLDSLSCIAEFQQRLGAASPPMILTSAGPQDEAHSQALQKGIPVAASLQKPVLASALHAALLQALEPSSNGHSAPSAPSNMESHAMQSLRGTRLLLVEDNDLNQELACELLRQAGIAVETADNGQIALDMLARDGAFDGILMDCQMPVMDGYSATRAIRSQLEWANLPILAMTANAMSGDKEKALQAGMNDHIAKPIEVDQMFATLRRWIRPTGTTGSTPQPTASTDASAGGPATAVSPGQAFAEPAPTGLIPGLTGIDTATGLHRCLDDERLYLSLLRRFAAAGPHFAMDFASALSDGQLEDATRHAHTLKGSAGNIGATALAQAAAHLELLCRAHAADDELRTQFQSVMRELTQVLTSLQVLDGMRTRTSDHETSKLPVETLISQLDTLLTESDIGALEVADELAIALKGQPNEELVQAVSQALGKLEFEDAKILLGQFMQHTTSIK